MKSLSILSIIILLKINFLIRILRLRENGLVDKWANDFVPKNTKCSITAKVKKENDHIRLSLGHLSGAFALLIIGCTLTVVVLLIEKLIAAVGHRK